MTAETRPEFTFNADPFEVAERLRSAHLFSGRIFAKILNAEGFTREENNKPLYRALLQLPPAKIVGISYRGAVLPLITTHDGSCVLLREISVVRNPDREQLFNNPDDISIVLGIDKGTVRSVSIKDPYIPSLRILPSR